MQFTRRWSVDLFWSLLPWFLVLFWDGGPELQVGFLWLLVLTASLLELSRSPHSTAVRTRGSGCPLPRSPHLYGDTPFQRRRRTESHMVVEIQKNIMSLEKGWVSWGVCVCVCVNFIGSFESTFCYICVLLLVALDCLLLFCVVFFYIWMLFFSNECAKCIVIIQPTAVS